MMLPISSMDWTQHRDLGTGKASWSWAKPPTRGVWWELSISWYPITPSRGFSSQCLCSAVRSKGIQPTDGSVCVERLPDYLTISCTH